VLAHGRDPYFPGWPDTLQVNHRHAGFREAMLRTLEDIARQCDGVRCDMAMLVLPDVIARTWGERARPADGSPPVDDSFWPHAVARVRRSRPDFVFMAEAYWDLEWTLQQQGFDYTYDKRLLDRLHHGDANEARGHLHAAPAYNEKLARFLENHDEARSVAMFGHRVRAAAAVTFTLPGLRFFFDGQLEGAHVRPPVQLGHWPEDPDRADIRDLYTRLLRTIDLPLFHDGHWSLVTVRGAGDTTNNDLIAFAWRNGADLAVVAANITDHDAQGLLEIGDLPTGDAFELHDQLSGDTYHWTRADLGNGLYVRLQSGGAHILLVKAT
jgi:hypothetical protein